ncbi:MULTISPECIES: SURF1 family protein [unclassified Sphingomonas]|uniref:SURF1 family protein n=1 Tax=unclassified Sphingomonas TaxID=196159 RepID=UPI002269A79D|nr:MULTISPECIES: SURF1 family protein [unclassified Sphingomonas]
MRRKRWALAALSAVMTLMFLSLGIWQVERRAWKLALISAVEERVHAPPRSAPPPSSWRSLDARRDAYLHVTVRGRFLNAAETRVQALTEDGAGFWVMTPLRTETGFVVLVNRGFVPPERANPATRPPVGGVVDVTGLLRMTEPGGSIMRSNQPTQDRWFSRDVAAIARARALQQAAPYFIDADSTANAGGWPRGGMTVLNFPNNHLVYSITWFALAMLSLVGLVLVLRTPRVRAGPQH